LTFIYSCFILLIRMRIGRRMIITYIVGAAVGAVAGFLYYRFVGCRSGTCPLTSTLYGSVLYGMVMGSLLSGLVAAR
jgi:hypothetical protein